MGVLQGIIEELECIQIRPEHRNQAFPQQGDTWISEKSAKKKIKPPRPHQGSHYFRYL
ncbi:hypothetical protein [Microbulbifer sp. VVAC002]|uniref:hypothetical protein n=1 Tax=Microbulbifer sp. VVAC002 TaxID=3243387 RepID=UPI00403A49B9